jgi:hypothetical protein
MATDVQHVGGRLEAVAPRRVTDAGDKLRIAGLCVVAIAVHGWLLVTTHVTARDSVGFARNALQIESPKAAGVDNLAELLRNKNREFPHPPGYPLAVLAMSEVVRPAYAAPLPEQMLLSAQLTSALAGVLLVLPTYVLGRMLFGKFAGFAAALLFQVLPVAARDTSDGLTEGLYLLAIASALLFGVLAVRKQSIGQSLLCGLATSMAYLIRPEGLLTAASVALVMFVLAVRRTWLWRSAVGRLTALLVGVMLPAAPYMILIGGVTNKPTGIDLGRFFLREKLLNQPKADAVVPQVLFGDTYHGAGQDGPQALWVGKALFKEVSRTFHYAAFGLAAIGLAIAFGRVRDEPWHLVPIAFGGLTLVTLVMLGLKPQAPGGPPPYISGRHTLPIVYVGCFFAAAGIEFLPRLLGRLPGIGPSLDRPAVAWVALAAVVVSCLPALKPLHEHRQGYKAAGEFLATELKAVAAEGKDVVVIDPYEWPQFYAGWSLWKVPEDAPEAPVVLAVFAEKTGKEEGPNSNKGRYDAALNVSRDTRARVVFEWISDDPTDATRIKVYRLDR